MSLTNCITHAISSCHQLHHMIRNCRKGFTHVVSKGGWSESTLGKGVTRLGLFVRKNAPCSLSGASLDDSLHGISMHTATKCLDHRLRLLHTMLLRTSTPASTEQHDNHIKERCKKIRAPPTYRSFEIEHSQPTPLGSRWRTIDLAPLRLACRSLLSTIRRNNYRPSRCRLKGVLPMLHGEQSLVSDGS